MILYTIRQLIFLGEEAHEVPIKRRYLAQLHGHSNYVMVNKLATIQGQSGYWYCTILTNGFSSLTVPNIQCH